MIGAVWTVRIWLLESYRISTPAMETALHEGDYILANKCLDLFPPRQNDIVLFTSPLRQDSTLRPLCVSRCIGMPGDTKQVSSEGYRINGRAFPRSPRDLNTYFIALSIKEAFLQQAERLNIPVRDLETEPFGITLCLTTFEEYQLREALGTDLSSRFVCRQIRPYQLVIPKKGRTYRLRRQQARRYSATENSISTVRKRTSSSSSKIIIGCFRIIPTKRSIPVIWVLFLATTLSLRSSSAGSITDNKSVPQMLLFFI